MDKVLVGFGLILLSVTLVVAAVVGLTARDFAPGTEIVLDPGKIDRRDSRDVIVTLGQGRQVDPAPEPGPTLEKVLEDLGNRDSYLNYTVQRGETLGKIADHHLGKSSLWQVIAEHNTEIRNPHSIAEGTVIRIPLWLKENR